MTPDIVVTESTRGLFFAESTDPDLKGLLVVAKDRDTLLKRVPSAIQDLRAARQETQP